MKLLSLLALPLAAVAAAPVPDRHVVVLVWDGMRPDFVSAETTPNLARLAADGVFFANHHPAYVSSTEVNGTAIATGAYPAHSGIMANREFRPAIDPQKPVDTQATESVRHGDATTGGRYLGRPTVAELLRAGGRTTAIAGAKQVALLHDRAERAGAPGVSPVLFEGATLPASLQSGLASLLGVMPAVAARDDKIARDAWTTQALIGPLWQDGVPAFSLLWLSEPDNSQHATGPGSAQSLEAIRGSDGNLGLVLAELDRRGVRATTDVLIVSDHGFSTVTRNVDVATEMSVAGFAAARAAIGGLRPGNVLVVPNGGASLAYVGGHDPEVTRRLVAWLQTRDWAGVIFSRVPVAGTFPLAEAHMDSPDAPDVVVSLRWSEGRSATGTAGLMAADNSTKKGSHASLSRYDMHNTLVAAGPDFRRGLKSTVPSGNTDVAPTVLWVLGLKEEAARMDGRVLGEALTVEAPPLQSQATRRLTAEHDTDTERWTQYLQVSEVNGVRYLDEGNGALVPLPAN